MKAFRSTSSGQFGQSGSFQPGTYTFNALVLSSTNSFRMRFSSVYGEVFVAADVTPNEWTKVEITFTLNGTYTRFDLSYNNNTVVIVSPMLEYGTNASTAVPHPDDIDEELHELGGNIIEMSTEFSQTKEQILLLATKTSQIEDDVTALDASLSIQAGQISGKVSQTDFNALGERVEEAEASLTLQTSEIASKVSQSDFNALGTRVATAEGTLSVQAGLIEGKVSQSEYDANNTLVGGQISTIQQTASSISLKVDSLKVGGVNLIAKKYLTDWNLVTAEITMESSDANGDYLAIDQQKLYNSIGGGSQYKDIFQGKISYKPNTQYAFKVRWRMSESAGEPELFFRIKYTDGTFSPDIYIINSTIKEDFLISEEGKTIAGIVCNYGENSFKALIYDIQLTEGNMQVEGWMIAPEDDKDKLLATGIDIEQKKIVVTAPQFIIRQNDGTPIAVFNENINIDAFGNTRLRSLSTPFVLTSPSKTNNIYNINFSETPHVILNGGVTAGYIDLPNGQKWNGAQITVALDNYIVPGNDSVFMIEIRASGNRIYKQEGVKASSLFLPNFRRVYYFFRGLWTGTETIWIVEDTVSMYRKLKLKAGEVIGGGEIRSGGLGDSWNSFGQLHYVSNSASDKDIGLKDVFRYTDISTMDLISDSELRGMYQIQFYDLGSTRVRITGANSYYNVKGFGELNSTAESLLLRRFVLVATKDIDLSNMY